MRQRYFEHGLSTFAPHEIMEIILYHSISRGNTNGTAHLLIDKFGSVSNVLDADPGDLMTVRGVGTQTAALIKLIRDLAGYYHCDKWGERPVLINIEETGAYVCDMVGDRTEEYFFLLSLDKQRKVINFTEVEKGTVSSSAVSIRKVVECAMRDRASSVVLVHNHPSGKITPSDSDIDVTHQLQNAFNPIDITVIDHIIVGGGGYLSMVQSNYLK